MTVSVAVSRFSSDLAVRMEPMLRLDTEEAPAEPTDGPTLPDVEGAVPEDVQDSALKNIESLGPIFGVSLNIAIGVLSGVLFTAVVALVVRIVMRRRKRMLSHLKILLMPGVTAMAFLGARIGLELSGQDLAVYALLAFLLLIGTAFGFAWLALRVINVVERRLALRYDEATLADRRGRRMKTQMQLIKRVLSAVIIDIAVAAMLLSMTQVRALGAGLLASAGLISVIAALAVQTTLTNVFAEMQLAFTDAIRVGDFVVMDDYYGTIEDITMSYVVLKIWDGRRIIYPSSYFTTTPFENYTRVGTEISSGIDFQVDWRVPVDALRARLRALVESSDLWDGRDAKIQVLDIANDRATLRVAVSARNAGELWDLQCLVREDFIKFISEEHPEAMNILRIEQTPPERLALEPAASATASQPATKHKPEPQPETKPKRTPTSWDMNSAPKIDKEKVQTWRQSEPPVEIGLFPTVPHKEIEEPAEPAPDTSSVPLTQVSEAGAMYTGSVSAIERSADMAGPGEDAYRSRAQRTDELDEVDTASEQQAADPRSNDDEQIRKDRSATDEERRAEDESRR